MMSCLFSPVNDDLVRLVLEQSFPTKDMKEALFIYPKNAFLSLLTNFPDISREYKNVNLLLLLLIVIFLLYPLGVTLPDLPHGFLPFNLPTLDSSFRNLPDKPCSSCGLTRSIVALYHGNLKASLNYNPVGIIVIIFTIWEFFVRFIILRLKNRWIAWLDILQLFLSGLCVRIILELNLFLKF